MICLKKNVILSSLAGLELRSLSENAGIQWNSSIDNQKVGGLAFSAEGGGGPESISSDNNSMTPSTGTPYPLKEAKIVLKKPFWTK